MNNYHPYYILIFVLIIFLLLWGLYGGKKYEFVGLQPLYPNYVYDYSTSIVDVTPHKEQNNEPLKKNDTISYEQIPPEITDTSYDIDLTPTIPDEFLNDICYVKNTGEKFESKPEFLCRQVLEKIYGVEFPNVRPDWLRNPETNRCLELDCYNENLKLALEYNGIQHYKWCSFAKQTYADFRNQVKRDVIKRNICAEKGVHLITVPYNISYKMIPLYIVTNLPEIIKTRVLEENIIDNL
jgi:hypothetical protein